MRILKITKAKKNQLYYAELYSTVYGTLNLIQENF